MTKLAGGICSIISERAPNEKTSTTAHSFSDCDERKKNKNKNKIPRMVIRKIPRAVQALEDVTIHFSLLTRARLLVACLRLPRCSCA